MTRADRLVDHYDLVLRSLIHESQACRPRVGECEPEPPERVAMCAARKREQLDQAMKAGVLVREW
jgi:hypothetical protein